MFSPHQETLIVNMVRENNAIKLNEILQKIIEEEILRVSIVSASLLLIVSSSATDYA